MENSEDTTNSSANSTKPRRRRGPPPPPTRSQREDFYRLLEESWKRVYIPPQPDGMFSPQSGKVRITQDFRKRIYELLLNWYPDGVDVAAFINGFLRRYGYPLSAVKECNLDLTSALNFMADIVDTGQAEDGQLWVRPVPYKFVRMLCREEDLVEFERSEYEPGEEQLGRKKSAEPTETTTTPPMVVEYTTPWKDQVRAEIADLLDDRDESVLVESLAIQYEYSYPERGMRRDKHQVLIEWLQTMPDLVDLYEEEEGGRRFVRLRCCT